MPVILFDIHTTFHSMRFQSASSYEAANNYQHFLFFFSWITFLIARKFSFFSIHVNVLKSIWILIWCKKKENKTTANLFSVHWNTLSCGYRTNLEQLTFRTRYILIECHRRVINASKIKKEKKNQNIYSTIFGCDSIKSKKKTKQK